MWWKWKGGQARVHDEDTRIGTALVLQNLALYLQSLVTAVTTVWHQTPGLTAV